MTGGQRTRCQYPRQFYTSEEVWERIKAAATRWALKTGAHTSYSAYVREAVLERMRGEAEDAE